MPFVQMKAFDSIVTERPQHAHATDAEHHFLAQSVAPGRRRTAAVRLG